MAQWALVTGGSSGIGLEFSRQLAELGYNIVLVARDANQLKSARVELASLGVEIETMSVDLADRKGVGAVMNRLKNNKKPVEVLVNNAGFVLHVASSSAEPADLAVQESAMQVMATDVLLLSATAVSEMKRRRKGIILNVASTTAWAYTGNYSAIKRWVVSYTEGLALELRGTGVTATVVCPGWAHTNFHKAGGRPEPHMPEWLFTKPEVIARMGLRSAFRGKVLSIPTLRWKIALWLAMHGPLALSRGFTKIYLSSRGTDKK
ncbi:MAG: SDR family NAD(P)-dependent oxidoreductase [Candidatus Nomurabacteria bacterium]|jgi:short-subunit dehydrogenase|nr:SDR family NAD(P)-dependent oxidoreductase [Candidatus Nomurabacteria bacterium]